MAGVYRARHPERTVLYQVLFHHFDRFLTEYESRFEREYGFFRPIVKEVVIAAIQTFGDRINLHMHLHFLVTEGGVDEAGVFHKIPRIDDSRLAEIFAREVLAMLVRKELLSPEWAERILSWPHSGFNVHSLVRAKTKPEAERVGKYMLRPVLALERLTFLEPDGKVDPMLCPKCGGRMKVIAFLTDFSVVDRIIGQLKLTFVAERPPPPQVASQELLMAADPPAEYFS
jgi:hypothetical protein